MRSGAGPSHPPKATAAPLRPPVLSPLGTDEVTAPPLNARQQAAAARVDVALPGLAATAGRPLDSFVHDRRATAAALRALDAVHGGGFFTVAEDATVDPAAAAATFAGSGPVVDLQTHLVDPELWRGPHAAALEGFLHLVDPDRWSGPVDPRAIDAAAWAALVFGASETSVALLTSTPGETGSNVLENAQIAAVRDVTERYAGTGRLLTHTIVHPNLGAGELERMADWDRALRPSAWKVYTLYGPPTNAAPAGGWFLDDEEVGFPFLEQVRRSGTRIVCTHKGLGGPVPDAAVATASPRDIGPAAAAYGDISFVVYHSGYERNPDGQEGAYDAVSPQGVDRLVTSLRDAGIGPGANVYAELGSTWFLMMRRPVEAAHVLGKLLAAVGPDRIVWGTDSTWYGSPQFLIDAFRLFTIPPWMQEQFGYPALTPEIKQRILAGNAASLYGIDLAAVDRGRDAPPAGWAAAAAPDLHAAMVHHRDPSP